MVRFRSDQLINSIKFQMLSKMKVRLFRPKSYYIFKPKKNFDNTTESGSNRDNTRQRYNAE